MAAARPALAIGVLAAALLAPSCAPPPPPEPVDAATLEARYFSQLEAREALARSMVADLALWSVIGDRSLPGVLATLTLAAPDRCRLRISSPGGALLDGVGAATHVRVWLPGVRRRADLTECADSAGLGDLPDLVVRGVTALWRPPAGATLESGAPGGARHFEWNERGRAIRVAMTSEGLPDTVTLAVPGGTVRILYPDWLSAEGTAMPREIRVTHVEARARLRCSVSRLRARAAADSSEFADPGPAGVTLERRCDLARLLGEKGSP